MRFGRLFISFFLLPILVGCNNDYSPKPRAYVRLDLPEPAYLAPDSNWNCPYTFEASRYSFLTVDKRHQKENCWYNIYYPKLKATIHLTYSTLDGNLGRQIEENRKLAMKHVGKATAINESLVENRDANVYGLIYEFKGETASDMQFFVTDSSNHFLRGSLYFNVKPNKDSLGPAIDYVKNDVRHFIQTLRWNSAES
ncbi:gliding motility lipoprotein GldD [bacterium]|nr:gliding motility lipoprotein GldD [bacterium]